MIKAIIPVRSGSKRVSNKNIKPFAGSNLLEIKITQLLGVEGLDGVCVSSDCPNMLDTAKSLGAETFLRDPYFASDTVPMNEVYRYMAEQVDSDDIMYATVTTPTMPSECYQNGIDLYKNLSSKFDCIHTVKKIREFMYKDGAPLNYDANSIPRSQDLPDIYSLVYGFSILPRKIMIKKSSNMGYHPFLYEVPDEYSVDIDTNYDFEIAEFLYKKSLIK